VARLVRLLLCALLAAPAAAAACADWSGSPRVTDVRAQAGGVTALVAGSGRLLVGLDSGDLKLYDLDGHADRPYLRDTLPLGAPPMAAALAGDLVAAVTAGPGRLHLLSRDGDALTPLGAPLGLPGAPADVALGDGFAYALCPDPEASPPRTWLVTVDVSDPAAPRATDVREAAHPAAALALAGGLLALAGPAEPNLELLSLADPAAPAPLGTWHGGALVRDVVLDGPEALLVGGDGLQVLAVADPAAPAPLRAVPAVPGWSRAARVDGLEVLLRTEAQGGVEGLRLADAADGAPRAALGLWGGTLAAAPGHLYLGRGSELVSVELRAATAPDTLAPLTPDAPNDVLRAVAAAGAAGVAAVRSDGGLDLWTLDLADPAGPVRLASLTLTGDPLCAAVGGGLVAVGVAGAVHLIDAADLGSPSLLGALAVPGDPTAVAFRGDVLDVLVRATDVAVSHRWLRWSVADPAAPIPAAPVYLPAAPYALLHDPAAATAVVAGDEFCDVYDVSDPLRPALLVDHIVGAAFRALARDGAGRVWAGLAGGLLVRLQGLTGGSFQLADAVWLPGDPTALLADGDRLWAACGDLVALDAAEPGAPVVVGQLGAGDCRGVAPGADAAVAAAGPLGLLAAPIPCALVGAEPRAEPDAPPRALILGRPYPNPFNPRVRIPFALARPGTVTLEVLDAAGRRIARPWSGPRTAGSHVVVWDGRDRSGRPAPSGVYVVRLRLDDEVRTRKLELLR